MMVRASLLLGPRSLIERLPVPPAPTRRFALGAVFVCQLILWLRFELDLDLRTGIKSFLQAA